MNKILIGIRNIPTAISTKLKALLSVKIDKHQLIKIVPIAAIVTFIITLFVMSLFVSKFVPLDTTYKLIQAQYQFDFDLSIEDIPGVKDKTNPLNGELITKEDRLKLENKKVFVVTMNNHELARPQSGLSQADIVMEVLTEGGITRYVALFYGQEPEKIGPVRSVRRYMLDFIAEYDSPVILHEGGASFNDADTVYVRATDAFADIYQYNYKSLQTADSRYRDQVRISRSGYVHSLFTSYKLINDSFDKMKTGRNWESNSDFEELKWKNEALIDDRGDFKSMDITFLDSFADKYRSGFEYNKTTNSYDRFIAGKEDFDELTNTRISPKNVIVEWHDYALANDGYARIIIGMIGEGDVDVLRDGKVIKGKWKKVDRTSRTRYFDDKGEEIEINRGQIWKVIAVKSGTFKYSKVEYKYENVE